MTSNETIELQKVFNNYKINDASNRNMGELIRITNLCHKISNLLVFIKRNQNNSNYFKKIEQEQNSDFEVNTIFLNKDDVYFFNGANIHNHIRYLKRKILNDTECSICFEKCIINFMSCSVCGDFNHDDCFDKLKIKKCPVCRNNNFNHYRIQNK